MGEAPPPGRVLDVYAALGPALWASRLCGAAPLRVVSQPTGQRSLQPWPAALLYGVLVLGLLLPATLTGLAVDLQRFATGGRTVRMKNTTSVVAALADILSVAGAALAGALSSWRRGGGQLASLLRQLHELDALLCARLPDAAPRVDARNRATLRRARILATALFAHLLFMFLFDAVVWQKVTGHLPYIYLPVHGLYLLVATLELRLAFVLWALRERFALLNALLARLGTAGGGGGGGRTPLPLPLPLAASAAAGQHTPGSSRPLGKHLFFGSASSRRIFRRQPSRVLTVAAASGSEAAAEASGCGCEPLGPLVQQQRRRLAALGEAHGRLCEAAGAANAVFGLPLLAHLLSLFLHLVITPYFFLVDLLYPRTYGNSDTAFLLLQLFWIATHAAKLLLVVQPCSSACAETNQTGRLVSQLFNDTPDEQTRKQLEVLALQLLHRRIEFSACGFCTVDFSLVASIAGSVTTYLVILVQFQASESHSSPNS